MLFFEMEILRRNWLKNASRFRFGYVIFEMSVRYLRERILGCCVEDSSLKEKLALWTEIRELFIRDGIESYVF